MFANKILISKLKWIIYLFIGCLVSCTSETSNDIVDTNFFDQIIQDNLKEVKRLQDSLEFDKAIELLQTLRLENSFRKSSDSLQSNVYHKYGLMLFKKENYYQAILELDTAIMIRTKIEEYPIEELANSYYLRSQARLQQNDEKALADIQQAIEYGEQIGDQKVLMKYYIFIATALQDRGDFGQAEKYYEKVLNSKILKEKSHQMALLYLNLGKFYFLQNNFSEQRKVLQKALRIYKGEGEVGEREYFASAITYGTSFLYQAKWKEGERYFVKVLDELKQSKKNYNKLEELCINNLAFINIQINNPQKARSYYTDMLELSTRMSPSKYTVTKAVAYEGLGDVDLYEAKFTAAITNYHKAIQSLFLDFDTDDIYANPTSNENPVLNKKDALRILGFKVDAHLKKFEANQEQLDLKEALEIYQFMDVLLTNIRQELKSASSRFKIVKENIPIYEKASLIALQLYELNQDKKYLNQAFHFATKNKAIVLQDGLQNERAKFAGIPSKLINQENSLKKEYYEIEAEIIELEVGGKASNKLSAKKNKRFEIIRSYEKLVAKLERDYPKYYSLKYEVSQVVDPETIANSLPDKTALVEFFVGNKNLFVFTISSEGLRHYTFPKPKNLLAETRKFRQMLQDSNSPSASKEYFEVAYSLYQSLFEIPLIDLEKQQEIKRLIIIPDNQLLQVSFDALMYEKNETGQEGLVWDNPEIPYLLKKYAISYAYSNKLMTDPESNKRIRKSLTAFAGFGLEYDDYTLEGINALSKLEVDTTLSRGMGKLYHSVNEIEEVKDIVGAGKLWRDTRATKKSFIRNAPNSKILHLAMHGYESTENPLNSALIFTREKGKTDFLLKAADLYTMSLPADMTVLSACHTASGKVYQGEGVRSLARAFRYAGCPSLVATLWSVSDYSTKAIMVDFYKHLKNGDDKDIALQKAKLNYIKTGQPSQKMPYFWTNLALIGETKALDF